LGGKNGITKGDPQMAIIVKAQITITKGFDTWQAMVKSQEARKQGSKDAGIRDEIPVCGH
jgi:hypothetical protein